MEETAITEVDNSDKQPMLGEGNKSDLALVQVRRRQFLGMAGVVYWCLVYSCLWT